MKRKLITLGIAVLLLFSVAGLTACSGQHKIYEEGFFQYIIVGENSRFPQKGEDGVIAIVGLTESGEKQEVIDFPRTLKGKNVKFIG